MPFEHTLLYLLLVVYLCSCVLAVECLFTSLCCFVCKVVIRLKDLVLQAAKYLLCVLYTLIFYCLNHSITCKFLPFQKGNALRVFFNSLMKVTIAQYSLVQCQAIIQALYQQHLFLHLTYSSKTQRNGSLSLEKVLSQQQCFRLLKESPSKVLAKTNFNANLQKHNRV